MTISVQDEAPSVDSGRHQVGSSPQHLLVTVLGDYWFDRHEGLPSAALVQILAEFGVNAVGARAALSRLARRGLLELSKVGRHTYYGLAPDTTTKVADGARRVLRFGADEQAWDGAWTLAAFSLPEQQRDLRHLLRSRLRWLGFAPLFDGVWVSPRTPLDVVSRELDELGVSTATLLRGGEVGGGWPLISAFHLEDLELSYVSFLDRWTPLVQRVRTGDVGAAEALVARTELMDVWRTFPARDPDLPGEVLPSDWPRAQARSVFADLYDLLGPLAEIRVQQVVRQFAPDLAPLVRHHTTTQLLAAG
jgi:phenylacetic acid degradation operon negative regulatory protein